VLIEADICGAGASGRNGGCALSWSAKYFTLERLFGVQRRCAWSVSRSAASGHRRVLRRQRHRCDYRLDGTLYTATNRPRSVPPTR
jgi:glycine/D-amino acid oxidase-like deaminating enzyme